MFVFSYIFKQQTSYSMTSIAIIDIIGAPYDGSTLGKRGLGGSESAIVLMSRELVKLGFGVQIFNNCVDNGVSPGIYDGVEYIHLSALDKPNNYAADIVISSRTVIPFLHPNLWKEFPELHPERFKQFKQNARLRVLWMHDTFCKGDHLLEPMVTHGDIHELFTLSDFHTSYITTCNHGNRRMFEVLKKHVFMTRNGIVKYHDEVDIAAKDPYLYVYNSSVTKGMVPLVEDIWPQIKQRIPQAKLKVIGGFYVFKDAVPDEQELTWRRLAADPKNAELDIEFTGILRQDQIADILANASYMIYPNIFPETFGISVLESLAYNTPLITTRFGALEETAVETAAWMIDYPVEPNNVFPTIDKAQQTARFVDLAVHATDNRYLHQQKMYYCNIVKDICTWDTVALQWKQHLIKRLGGYLSVAEYRRVTEINTRVHQVFGRRFTNKEEIYLPRKNQQRIVVVSPVYNAKDYVEQCIQSVVSQDYDNYHMYIVDDASTDNTYELAGKYAGERVTVIKNTVNRGAVYNQLSIMREYCGSDDIVMLLDGDDSLVNNNQIFHYYNNLYDGTTEFTYGSCWSLADNIPLIAQHYPSDVKQQRAYRQHRFNWNMPYTHLRTFKASLLDNVSDDSFKDAQGKWYRAGGDGSVFYALIEQADPNKVKAVADVIVNYNDKNPLNDYKINSAEQTRNADEIIKGAVKKEKKILIAIPTARNIEAQTFKSIYDLTVPEGYTTEFQFFYGYRVDQVRNLIASWAERYDYLFSVDSDIVFASDTLAQLLAHDKDIVSGLYIQRIPGRHTLEVYESNGHGGVSNISYERIKGQGLVEIQACGFGCVLIKSQVFKDVGYPYFEYYPALDHKDTISEDVDFCRKARDRGYKLYADTSIQCEHLGTATYKVE